MKLLGILIGCAMAAGAASNNTVLIRNVDVYPVTSEPVKGVSILVLDGKIAEIGAKIVAPKGVRVVEGKGLRVYPGMIDSPRNWGSRRYVDPRNRRHGRIRRVHAAVARAGLGESGKRTLRRGADNGITSVMTFPASGGGGGRSRRAAVYLRPGGADPHRRLDLGRDGDSRAAAMHVQFPSLGPAADAADAGACRTCGRAGGTFTEMMRTYQQEVAKLNDFFDEARQYQKAKAANCPASAGSEV